MLTTHLIQLPARTEISDKQNPPHTLEVNAMRCPDMLSSLLCIFIHICVPLSECAPQIVWNFCVRLGMGAHANGGGCRAFSRTVGRSLWRSISFGGNWRPRRRVYSCVMSVVDDVIHIECVRVKGARIFLERCVRARRRRLSQRYTRTIKRCEKITHDPETSKRAQQHTRRLG